MTDFSTQLKQFADRTVKEIDEVRAEATIMFGEAVINGTPVKTGLARGDWMSSEGSPLTTKSERPRPWVAAVAQLRSVARKIRGSAEFFFTNNQPHIHRLEYGWSDQAPNGMLRLAALQWPRFIAEAVRKVRGRMAA